MSELFPDQITIFRHLTIDELSNSINEGIFTTILKDKYNKFIELCNNVIDDETVDRISCSMENDNLQFEIIYKEKTK